MKRETRIFNRSDIQSLMSLSEHIDIVEKALQEEKVLVFEFPS